MSKLKIKPSFLDSFGFPFDLKVGYVGNINVQIPWLNLTSAPLIIEVSEVFILLDPKLPDKWNAEDMWKVYTDF